VKARQEQLEQNVRKAWGGNLTVIATGRRPKGAVAG